MCPYSDITWMWNESGYWYHDNIELNICMPYKIIFANIHVVLKKLSATV